MRKEKSYGMHQRVLGKGGAKKEKCLDPNENPGKSHAIPNEVKFCFLGGQTSGKKKVLPKCPGNRKKEREILP